VVVLAVAFFLRGLGMTGCNVHVYALRQAIVPDDLLGRVNGTYSLLTFGFVPLGALLGGVLGELLGLRTALLVCALGLFPSWAWLAWSPARRLRRLPDRPLVPSTASP
jgi:MFS family permease